MKFSKKASMQLSINAIVILVLAMAVLGLGLGIVKMVKQRANDINIDVDLSETADSSKPIANLGDTFELRANKQNDMGISFYNTANTCESTGARIHIDCDSALLNFTILQAPAKISPGTAGKLIARIEPTEAEDASDGTDIKAAYACDFQIYCTEDYDPETIEAHKSVIIDVIA